MPDFVGKKKETTGLSLVVVAFFLTSQKKQAFLRIPKFSILYMKKLKRKECKKNVKRKYPDKAYLSEGFRAFA